MKHRLNTDRENYQTKPIAPSARSAVVPGCGCQHRLGASPFSSTGGETPPEPAGEDACATRILPNEAKPHRSADFYTAARKQMGTRVTRPSNLLPNEPNRNRREDRMNKMNRMPEWKFTERSHAHAALKS